MSTLLHVSALPPDRLDRVRARGIDDFGNPVVVEVNEEVGAAPLRCCLREAEVGEQVALVAWRPATVPGVYAEVGPVFVHPERCGGWTGTGYPEGFRHRRQLLRCYDERGRQVDNLVVEGTEVEAALSTLLARPEISCVHSRNVLAGCYLFQVDRAC